MFRYLILLLYLIISGCGTSDNPTETTDIPENVRMSVTSVPDTLSCGVDGTFTKITVTLSDESGHPLQLGLPVFFSASLGSIQSTALTNEYGGAIVRYVPSSEPGVAQITATYKSVHGPVEGGGRVCIVDPRDPVYFVVSADPPEVSIVGRGNNSTSIISAVVMNGIGEPVTEEVDVRFQLFGEPDLRPARLNGNDQDETVETVNGVAEVGYNASVRPYNPRIRITTTDLDNNELIYFSSPLTVVSGRPFMGAVEMCNEGIDAGGGTWKVEVSCRAWDIQRNPVKDGIPVVFTVEPEIATVGSGFTGNKNRHGISTPGVAFTELVYHSVNTFDRIEIGAEIQWERMGMANSLEAVLPLQNGKLDFNADPGNCHFNEDNERARIKCWVVLTDGHGVLIDNAPILFTTSRSKFYWRDFRNDRFCLFYPEPAIKLTSTMDGHNHINHGKAAVYLLGEEQDFFFDLFTFRTEVELEAKVLGYESETTKTRTLVVTRSIW